MNRSIFYLFFCLCLLIIGRQVVRTQDLQQLEPNKPVEREISSGQEQSYKINLSANQFVRIQLDQKAFLDAALILVAPDNNADSGSKQQQLAEMNLTGAGEQEALAFEPAVTGSYNLIVRNVGTASTKMTGSYRLEMLIQPTANESDRKFLTAQNLFLEAQKLAKQNSSPLLLQAIEKFEQSLAMWRSMNQPYWSMLTLKETGRAYMNLNRYDKAIEAQEQAIAISRELKNRIREGVILNELANSYFNQQQFEKAAEYFRQCMAIFRDVKDRRREGLMIYALGNTQNNLNQPENAIASFEQALSILREVNERGFEGQALLSLGNVYLKQGQSDKAIEITNSALTIFHEIKNYTGEGMARINLGIVYSQIGESEKAVKILEPALAIFGESKNRMQEAVVLNTLGLVYGGTGETEKAIEYFKQSLAISRQLQDKPREASALNNLGLAYSFLSKYETAIEYLEQSLPIAREIKDRQFEANTYSNLGTVYADLSQFEKAIESHEKSLTLYRELKSRIYEGNELENLGNAYTLFGRDDRAVEYFNQSLAVFSEVKYPIGEANVLLNLSDSYSRLNRDEEAIRVQQQALDIFREQKYKLGEGTALMSLGIRLAKIGQNEKALETYGQALSILREVKNQEFEALTLFRMGESKQQLNHTDEAAALFTDSAAIFQAIGSRNYESGALTALAKTERERGNLIQARKTVEQSLQISESVRADLISPESRAAFLSGIQDPYQLYTDLLMLQHQNEPQKGFDRLAVEVAERQRARSLLDLLTESNINLRQGVDSELIERERALAKKLSDKAEVLMQSSGNTEQRAAKKQEISQLEIDLERAQTAIRKASPNYANLTQPQPIKLRDIQAELDPDTLLLEYSLGNEHSYLWAITKDSLTSYELPPEDEIKEKSLAVYNLLTARNASIKGETVLQKKARIAASETTLPLAAKTLSDVLLKPAAAQFGNKRLVIVADGALQYIPFAMLPEPLNEKSQALVKNLQPLIVKHEIVSLPSASTLAVQRTELANRQPAPQTLAVIADPVFNTTDARFNQMTAKTESSDQQKPSPMKTFSAADERGLEYIADENAHGKLVIRRLPFTEREADELLALTPKKSSFEATGFEANRETVTSGKLANYRYVHFATHGLLDTERPGLSALVLSMVDAKGNAENGFLRANDIYNLKLPAELVVLSACQTGLGKEVKGEGLIGLTRGFMYAGAKRVTVSLWSVNDQATAELMEKFYRGMLKDNARPAAALRAAQIEMWKQKQWQSPYYWSAFIIQGEWR